MVKCSIFCPLVGFSVPDDHISDGDYVTHPTEFIVGIISTMKTARKLL